MSKIRQFILFVIFACLFATTGVIILGRSIEVQSRDALAREFMQQQIVVSRQVVTALQTAILDEKEKLETVSHIEEVRNGGKDICSKRITEILGKIGKRIVLVGRIDRGGKFDCSTDAKIIGISADDLIPRFKRQAKNLPFLGRLSSWNGKAIISLNIPLQEDQGRILSAFIYFQDLEETYLSNLKILNKGETLLIDDTGTLLFVSKGEYKNLVGTNIFSEELAATALANKELKETYNLALAGYSGTGQYTIDQRDMLVTYEAAEVLTSQKWVILMYVPRGEIDSVIASLTTHYQRTFLILLVLAAVFLSGVIIVVFVFHIARPIEQLKKAALLISEGRLDVEISSKANDEIGSLAQALKFMEMKLRHSYGELEGRVRQRTDQLAERIQQLVREKAKDDAILESIGEGLVVTGQDGNLIVINEEAQHMLGVVASQVIGKIFAKVVAAEDEQGVEMSIENNPISRVFATGRKLSTTLYYLRSDSTKFLAAVNVSPIVIEGRIIGVVQIFRDVTREKEVDRMKTEFISLASHQLRTPLSAMKWFLEMLLAGDAGELNRDQKYFVENVNKSNERMIQLVNALLNVSRIESGRIIVDPKPTDLGKLFNEVLSEYAKKIEERKLQLSVSVHPSLPIINIDPKLIREVYSNLLSNAIKYTPTGGEISVFISKKADIVLFQITDTGYGVPRKEQPRVFQKFYRGENVIPIESDGSGLGLYLTRAVVESSGGQIWFESQEGHGTTFWFSLPLSGSPAKAGEVSLNS